MPWYRLVVTVLAPKMESEIGGGVGVGLGNLLSLPHCLVSQTLAVRLPFSSFIK